MSGNNILNELLEDFWGNVVPTGDSDFMLRVLVQLAETRVSFKKRASYQRRRNQANKRKRSVIKKPCLLCKCPPPSVRHHIIQIQHNGDSRKKNVIPLCKECHALIHPWLQ